MCKALIELSSTSFQFPGYTDTSKETSKGARSVVLGRVELNLAGILLNLGARLFKLFDCGIAQLVGLGLCIIGDRPCRVEMFLST